MSGGPRTVAEVQQLLATTAASGVVQGMTGPGRAMLYRLAVESGLRYSEIRSLSRELFTLDREPVCVKVKAAYSKRRREDSVPLRPELANVLQLMLAQLGAEEQVFKMPHKENVARMFRQDLEAAGIVYRDADGKVADFHALRHTCGSWLMAANVHPKVIQQVMRHSTIKLTMDRYTHVFQSEEVQAVSQQPTLTASHGPVGASASGVATADQSTESGPKSWASHWALRVRKHANRGDRMRQKRGLIDPILRNKKARIPMKNKEKRA